MVERRWLPRIGCVTSRTVRAELTIMPVILGMTGSAVGRRAFEHAAGMAGHTLRPLVGPG